MSQPASAPPKAPTNAQRYWRANLMLLTVLLTIWAVVAFVVSIVLAEPLNAFSLAGFPLGFWMAQQGSIIVFVVLILIYCAAMRRLDRRYGVNE